MKRIFQLCLFFSLIFLTKELSAQGNYTVTPNPQCYNPSNSYSATAAIVLQNACVGTSGSYTWNVVHMTNPAGCPVSVTVNPSTVGAPSGTSIVMSMSCCGVYSITCTAYDPVGIACGTAVSNTTAVFNTYGIPNMTTFVIACPNDATITPGSSTICANVSTTLTALSAANSWTWSNGATTPSIVVSPSVNTCYSYSAQLGLPTVGTIPGATCAITPTNQVCLSVQAVNATVSPASQTMCANSPITFTVNTAAIGGTSAIPGSAVTGYSWYPPGFPLAPAVGTNSPVFSTLNINPGTWTCIVHHTNAAIPGGCTTSLTAIVATGTNVSLSISPSSPSICPNTQMTLTAVSAPTTGASYTWTQVDNTGVPVVSIGTGNPKVTTLGANFPYVVTASVNYGGCPGSASYTVGLLTLTPTITPSTYSMCPGTAITLTAHGASNYTFSANPGGGGTISPLGVPPSSVVTYVTPNTLTFFPVVFHVSADSAGCVGTGSVIVQKRDLFPRLSLSQTTVISSGSVCPNNNFTLSAHSVGNNTSTPTTYTFFSPFTPSVIGAAGQTNSFVVYNPPTPVGAPQVYTVQVDSAGCRGTGTGTVNLLTLQPQISASAMSVCPNTSVVLTSTNNGAGTTYTFMAPTFTTSPTFTIINSPPTNSNSAAHEPSFAAPNPTTFVTYTVQVDSVGCKGTGTITIHKLLLSNLITLSPIPAHGSVCPNPASPPFGPVNNQFTLNATGATSYTFVAPGSNTLYSGSVNSTTVLSPASIGAGVTYTVYGDSLSCTGSQTFTIKEFKLNPTISVSPTLVCAGMPVTVTASGVSGGVNTNSVNYTFYAAVPPAAQATINPPGILVTAVHNPTAPTVYSVSVDSMGCTGVSPGPTTSVAIRPVLSLTATASDYSICPGLTSTLNVVGPVGNTSITYTWTAPAGASITPGPPSPTAVVFPTVATTYSVNALDSLGCVGDAVVTIGMDPAQSFSLALANSGSTICPGQSVTLSASTAVETLGGNGTYSYTWTPTTGLNPLSGVGQSVVATANPSMLTSIIYTVVASNPYGCVATETITLPIGQFPNITTIPFPSNVICPGFSSTLSALGANTYTWSGPGTYTSPIAQQSIAVSVPGTYSVIGSNGGGCTSTAVFSVIQGTNLTITATADSPTTCIANNFPKFSQAVHLTASGASSYVWFPYDPLHMTYSLGPQTDVTPAASTCYTVVGSNSVCSGSTTICVNVIPQFTMEVTPTMPGICLGDSLEMKIGNISTLAEGPTSAFTYSWSEALNAPPISLTEYFAPTTISFPQNTTTYTVEMKDSRQCISMPRLVTVTVFPRPMTAVAIPTINGIATNTVCYVGNNPGAIDVTINLIAYNTNQSLPFGLVPTYTWISPYLPKYNSILTEKFSSSIIANAPVAQLNNSSIVVYTVVSSYNLPTGGCKRYDTVSVHVVDCRPVRNVFFSTVEPNDTICTRDCITFVNNTDTAAGGPQELEWKFEGGNPKTSTEREPTVCYNLPGKYYVILKVKNPYPKVNPDGGATGSAVSRGILNFVSVTDIPNVTIVTPGQLRSDTIIRFGDAINLNGSGALSYQWSPAYNITSLTKPKVTVNPYKTTQYILTGYNSKKCFSKDTINVIVIEDCGEMYVPNAFTPNNDGANDVLYVRGRCLQSLTFMVFNRWGEKVFETTDQSQGWDGTYKGEPMNTAVFVFRLEGKTYDGKAYTMKGNVTLIR